MKKLFLVASTPLDQVEIAISKLNKKLEKEKKKLLSSMMVWGRADETSAHMLYHSNIVLFLGPNAYKANADNINPDAIGIMFGDPMNLNCIKGDGVELLDFTPREDGFKFYLNQKSPMQIAKKIYKATKAPMPQRSISVEVLDFLPTIINGVMDTVSFVQYFSAINYSIRNEVIRDKIQTVFLAWIKSNGSTEDLRTQIMAVSGIKKNNRMMQAIIDVFEAKPRIKNALNTVYTLIEEKKPNPNLEKIALNAKISTYDLKYMAALMRKKTLLIQEENSENVHKARAKERFSDNSEADVFDDYDALEEKEDAE